MESNELNSLPPPDDAFEKLLRANAVMPPLDDDGFSRRVIAALPPARRPAPQVWLAAAGLAAGLVTVLAGIALAQPAPSALVAFNTELVDAVDQLLTPAGTGALAITVGSLWFAFRDRWHPAWTKRF